MKNLFLSLLLLSSYSWAAGKSMADDECKEHHGTRAVPTHVKASLSSSHNFPEDDEVWAKPADIFKQEKLVLSNSSQLTISGEDELSLDYGKIPEGNIALPIDPNPDQG